MQVKANILSGIERLFFLSDFDAVFSIDSLLNYLSVVHFCMSTDLTTESSIYLTIIMAFLFWGQL